MGCVGQPVSVTGLYVLGARNGISNVSSSGDIVLARQFSGQCGAATDGCGGGRDEDGGTGMFAFRLGTWEYLGRTSTDIPDSTQTTDPLGRTWVVQALDGNGRNFLWVSGGNPNAPPLANATATNLSAESRTDKTNYYGDKWQLQDASVSAVPITRIDWDFIYKGALSCDEVGAPLTEATFTGYLPCAPGGVVQGSLRTGANCMQSLGLTNPPAANSYRFAMQSANQNGTSASPFISSTVQFACPQATILGCTGFSGTCAKTSGTLGVLAGGSADASGSQGNLAEASVNWSFTGSSPINVQGLIVPVPSGATGFTLTITYPGGYRATAQGNIVQANLVAAFSLAPDPVLTSSSLTLTNQMQVANATLDSVNYVISQGACSSSFSGFFSAPQLPGARGDGAHAGARLGRRVLRQPQIQLQAAGPTAAGAGRIEPVLGHELDGEPPDRDFAGAVLHLIVPAPGGDDLQPLRCREHFGLPAPRCSMGPQRYPDRNLARRQRPGFLDAGKRVFLVHASGHGQRCLRDPAGRRLGFGRADTDADTDQHPDGHQHPKQNGHAHSDTDPGAPGPPLHGEPLPGGGHAQS